MYMSQVKPNIAATVAVATPCCPAPVSAMRRRFPIFLARSAWPIVLFILCAPVWARSSLFKYIRYAEIVLQQSHGRLYPPGGFPFISWTFLGSYDVITIPLFFNIAFETGGRFFYIDTGSERNNQIQSGDFFFEARLGINWGFK